VAAEVPYGTIFSSRAPHCEVGANRLAFARMFDWRDEMLA
jgi:hypothetical protein